MSLATIWKYVTVDEPYVLALIAVIIMLGYIIYKRIMRNKSEKKMIDSPRPMVRGLDKDPSFALDELEPQRQIVNNDNGHTNIIDDIRSKSERLQKDLSNTRTKVASDLERVRSIKKDIFETVAALRNYYRDLSMKEESLATTLNGLRNEPRDNMVTDRGRQNERRL